MAQSTSQLVPASWADYKLYWQVRGSDGGTTERTIGYNTFRFGSYQRQIRRVPLISAYAAR